MSDIIKLIQENSVTIKNSENILKCFNTEIEKGGVGSGRKTIRLRNDKDIPASISHLKGKDHKVKSSRDVDFASGKQKYYTIEHEGKTHEIPERFIDIFEDKQESKNKEFHNKMHSGKVFDKE